LANHLAFHSSDLFCLDDIPSSLAPAQTHFVLVDHNVLQGDLGQKFSSRVSAIIDHHEDEGGSLTCKPRIITGSGSCCSLVSEYFREKWDGLHLPADINAQLAKLALAPILDDTSNLQHRVTPADVAAVTHLVRKCQQGNNKPIAEASSSSSSTLAGTTTTVHSKFSQDDFYKSVQRAKLALDHMSLSDLLRKDYKEWTDSSNNIKLGISSVPKSLYWLIQRESQSDKKKKIDDNDGGNDDNDLSSFYSTLKSWSTERSLDVLVIMTRDAGQEDDENNDGGADFTRDLFIWGVTNKAKDIKTRLLNLDKENEKLGLEKWEGTDEFNIESHDRQAWKQKKIEKSRKQVAPYLREVVSKL